MGDVSGEYIEINGIIARAKADDKIRKLLIALIFEEFGDDIINFVHDME